MTAAEHCRLQLPDGALEWSARGDGPPVVLAHGFALDRRFWGDLSGLGDGYRVIAYDLRGFGESSASTDLTCHGADLGAIIDTLAHGRAHVIGHSFGGQAALELALSRPAAVRSLTLVGSGLPGRPSEPQWRRLATDVRELAATAGVAAARRRWLASPMFAHAGRDPARRALLEQLVGDYSGAHWLAAPPGVTDQLRTQAPPSARLGEITAPTLVVVGEQESRQAIATADDLVAGIPHAQLARIPAASHFPNLEQPAAFWPRIRAFLDDVQSRSREGSQR